MPKLISSSWMLFYKRIFPALWFGVLAIITAAGLTAGSFTAGSFTRDRLLILPFPGLMAVFGFFIMKFLVWDLVDEVLDDVDALIVRNRGTEQRIPLADILNVSFSMLVNPPRVTLSIGGSSASGPFGGRVAFSPIKEFSFNPFKEPAVVEDLIQRIHRARSSP